MPACSSPSSLRATPRTSAESKRVALELRLPPRPVHARAEELLCYSIVANLLRNAVEASPEDETVTVALEHGTLHGDEGRLLRIHNAGAVPEPIRADGGH